MKRRNHIFLFFLLLTLVLCLGLCSCREEDPPIEASRNIVTLSAPTGLTVADDVLYWEPVEGALGYTVMCEGEQYNTNTNNLDIFCIADRPGFPYSFTVIAKGNGESILDSPTSLSVDHTFTASSEGLKFIPSENGLTYLAYAGNYEKMVGKIYIPGEYDGYIVSGIAPNGFKGCTGITGIVMHNNIETIGDKAFDGCSALSRISIPWTVTSIGSLAFQNCAMLRYVELPESLSDIPHEAFTGCTALSSLKISSKNRVFTAEGNCLIKRKDGVLLIYVGDGSGTLPSSVKAIGDYAFYQSTLKKIILHDGITSIGNYAFSGSAIQNPVLPSTLIAIGQEAFSRCTGIEKIIFGSNVQKIGTRAFYDCPSLSYIAISESVAEIGDEAFASLDQATVMLSGRIRTIGGKAFGGNKVVIYTDYDTASVNEWPRKWGIENDSYLPWKEYKTPYCANCLFAYDDKGNPYVAETRLIFKDRYSGFNDGPFVGGAIFCLNPLIDGINTVGILVCAEGIPVPVREGYTFLGWALEENGTVIHTVNENGHSMTSDEIALYRALNSTTTLYAVWEKN